MPTYTFYNSETEEQWDDLVSNDEREKFLEDNPQEIKTRDTISKHAKTVARDGFSASKNKTL